MSKANHRDDPVSKQSERGVETLGLSPMDPPDPYAPPAADAIPVEELHPFLQNLVEEHESLRSELSSLEDVIRVIREEGFSPQADRALMKFLEAFDRDFVQHSRAEDNFLFPVLRQRLIDGGEHSRGATVTTAADVLRHEHMQAIQLAAVFLNLLRVGAYLPDERSALLVIDTALREAGNLVELLRLHMFREDTIAFAQAHRLIGADELDQMAVLRLEMVP